MFFLTLGKLSKDGLANKELNVKTCILIEPTLIFNLFQKYEKRVTVLIRHFDRNQEEMIVFILFTILL